MYFVDDFKQAKPLTIKIALVLIQMFGIDYLIVLENSSETIESPEADVPPWSFK